MRKTSIYSHPWLAALLSLSATNYSVFDKDENYTQPLLSTSLGVIDNQTDLFLTGNGTAAPETSRNCVPPSIDEFPGDFFDDVQRIRGGFLVHALIIAYVCATLAIVCERYFVPSLRVISNYFNVPPDIAGATFMAIGTSSPELFSSVIGAFVAKGDIGIGTVVGSAVFNLLGVTGASGIAIGVLAVQLDWYPITRDCIVYVITVASLVIVIHDNLVTWIEAACLLLMFMGYLLILYFNKDVRSASHKTVDNMKLWWEEKEGDLVKLKASLLSETSPLLFAHKVPSRYYSYDDSACPSSESPSSVFTDSGASDTLDKELDTKPTTPAVVIEIIKPQFEKSVAQSLKLSTKLSQDCHAVKEEYSLCKPPEGIIRNILWAIMWPANLLLSITIPICTTPEKLKWFPLTFFMSIVWLGILSYISFWMAAIIGNTFGIPDTVSGLTILAAGTSVPELVASIIVVKSGMANMAISNLIGSNIFDILFCLGLPWLVKALLNTETRSVIINSSALTYTTLILLSAIILFYFSLVAHRFRYGRRVGIVALCLYACFLVLASLYESNVFGDFNPPPCPPS